MSKEYPCVHWTDGICKLHSGREITSWCVEAPCADQKPSNADRIRSMTDEELAEFFRPSICYQISLGMKSKACNGWCKECVIEWLQQPAEEDT